MNDSLNIDDLKKFVDEFKDSPKAFSKLIVIESPLYPEPILILPTEIYQEWIKKFPEQVTLTPTP